jgi:guanylate kinase
MNQVGNNMIDKNIGCLFIVSAPSGGGKTSLVKELINREHGIEVSISHTTRERRPLEKDGINYFFISEQEFCKMIKNKDFIEHAEVFGNLYGTSKAQINNKLDAGIDVVLDIDWQGAEQIKALFPDSVGIFVVPPSLEILESRLIDRAQDKEDIIQNRMQRARKEMSHYKDFDYLIINDDFNNAADDLIAIVKSKRVSMGCQIKRQQKLLSFLLMEQ